MKKQLEKGEARSKDDEENSQDISMALASASSGSVELAEILKVPAAMMNLLTRTLGPDSQALPLLRTTARRGSSDSKEGGWWRKYIEARQTIGAGGSGRP